MSTISQMKSRAKASLIELLKRLLQFIVDNLYGPLLDIGES